MRQSGYISEQLELLTVLYINSRTVPLLIDTGYSGSIMLPIALAEILEFSHTNTSKTAFLADGKEVKFAVYKGFIEWLGEYREIMIDAYDPVGEHRRGSPLGIIGTGLLNPYALYANYLNEEVIIGMDLNLSS